MSRADDLLVPLEEIEAFLRPRGWTWEQLERGDCQVAGDRVTVDEVVAHLLVSDPVLWCEAFLVNKPEDGGGTWRLFDYQKPSMRFRGDVVHEDGAEVGKTREIVGLLLWGSVCQTGGQLVAGAEDGNLDEIWDEIEWQLSQNEWLRGQLVETKQKPYRKQQWRNGNRNVFRPAGHDGRAFRGVHVALCGFFDEAAKVDNQVTFDEFYRALKPFCGARLYSVPDGRRASPFYQICQRSVPYTPASPSASGLLSPAPAATAVQSPSPSPGGAATAAPALPGEALFPGRTRRRFTRFNWPKTLMPAPFWSPDREQEAIDRYGGRDSSGYVRNVLGQWGDPEESVFPWAQFSPCLRYVEEYVVAKVLFDNATSSIYVDAWQLSPGYQVRSISEAIDDRDEDLAGAGPLRELYRERFGLGNCDLGTVLRRIFTPPSPGAHLVGGIDVGKSLDQPTEAGFSELRGGHQRWTARLQVKRLPYDQQAIAICALDEIFTPDHGWGLDAGGVGAVVEDFLRGGGEGSGQALEQLRRGAHRFDDRLTGFIFQSKTDVLGPDGEPLLDPASGNPRRVTFKELSTQLLETGMQLGGPVIPWDPDYVRMFPSHTARKLAGGERTFSQRDDHVIDEKRVEQLRIYELAEGGGYAPPMEFSVPAGSRRAAAALDSY